jgi:hypothetical protein
VTVLGIRGSCPQVWSLRWSVSLVLAVMVRVQPVCAGSSIDAIDWLWTPPPNEARVELRITSVDAAGKRQLAEGTLQYFRHGDESYLTVTIAARDCPARVYCVRCDAVGGLNHCKAQTGLFPQVLNECVPGTLMPWRAMLFGFCHQVRAVELEALSDLRRHVVELQPEEPNGVVPEFKLRVFVSKATQLPEEVVYLDGLGREQATLEIIETCKTKWGRMVTRSIYRDLRSGVRVLVEVRGGSVVASHAGEGKAPEPSHAVPTPRREQ